MWQWRQFRHVHRDTHVLLDPPVMVDERRLTRLNRSGLGVGIRMAAKPAERAIVVVSNGNGSTRGRGGGGGVASVALAVVVIVAGLSATI